MTTIKNHIPEIADVRDGLNRKQRVILQCLHQLQTEKSGRFVPTAMLYGCVLEYIDIGIDEMQAILNTITKSHN